MNTVDEYDWLLAMCLSIWPEQIFVPTGAPVADTAVSPPSNMEITKFLFPFLIFFCKLAIGAESGPAGSDNPLLVVDDSGTDQNLPMADAYYVRPDTEDDTLRQRFETIKDKILNMFKSYTSDPDTQKKLNDFLESCKRSEKFNAVKGQAEFWLTEVSLPEQTLGTVIILIGLFVMLTGRTYFRSFMSCFGFLIGSCVGLITLDLTRLGSILLGVIDASKVWYAYAVVCVLTGLLFAYLFTLTWSLFVYQLGFVAGACGSVLAYGLGKDTVFAYLGMKAPTVFVLGSVAGIVFSRFFEGLVLIVASSLLGALATVYGVDMIMDWQFRLSLQNFYMPFISDQNETELMDELLKIITGDATVAAMYLCAVFLAVFGMVTQMLWSPHRPTEF